LRTPLRLYSTTISPTATWRQLILLHINLPFLTIVSPTLKKIWYGHQNILPRTKDRNIPILDMGLVLVWFASQFRKNNHYKNQREDSKVHKNTSETRKNILPDRPSKIVV